MKLPQSHSENPFGFFIVSSNDSFVSKYEDSFFNADSLIKNPDKFEVHRDKGYYLDFALPEHYKMGGFKVTFISDLQNLLNQQIKKSVQLFETILLAPISQNIIVNQVKIHLKRLQKVDENIKSITMHQQIYREAFSDLIKHVGALLDELQPSLKSEFKITSKTVQEIPLDTSRSYFKLREGLKISLINDIYTLLTQQHIGLLNEENITKEQFLRAITCTNPSEVREENSIVFDADNKAVAVFFNTLNTTICLGGIGWQRIEDSQLFKSKNEECYKATNINSAFSKEKKQEKFQHIKKELLLLIPNKFHSVEK